MIIYYLMVKTHKKTGLQYLCQTQRKNPAKYKGSGKYWKLHIRKHGNSVDTRILLKCYTQSALREWGIYYSNLWSVVESNKWANMKPEEGGGSSSETMKEIMNRPDVRAKTLTAQNTPEYKAKRMGENNSSKRPEVRAKIAASVTGTKASAETRSKLREIQKIIQNRPEIIASKNEKITCDHCGVSCNRVNYHRWHGENCKLVRPRDERPKIKCGCCEKLFSYNAIGQHEKKCRKSKTV